MGFQTYAFTAKAKLVELLNEELDAADGWPVRLGWPTKRPSEKQIWVDEKVTNWTQEPISTGMEINQEDFRIDIYIYNRFTTEDPQVIADQIGPIADTVVDVVGRSPFLGGVVSDARVATAEYDGGLADSAGRQREGFLRLTIACTAYPHAA